MNELSPLNHILLRGWRRLGRLLGVLARRAKFRHGYVLVAAVLLVVATAFWAALGTRVHLYNADQLSDPYLFTDWKTFHGATFPSAHTFLFKWPVFWLISLFGVSATSLLVATVAVTVLTMLALMLILSRIVRRPLVLGTLYLLLAALILLIPAQPYAGGLLPVSMAMVTTRNLEYVLYLLALILCIKTTGLKSWRFWASVAVLGLLIASDKLFLVFALGSAAAMLVLYASLSNWRMVSFAVRWFLAGVAAALSAVLLLTLLSGLHVTHFSSGASVNPYSITTGASNVITGSMYALLALLTNFGANPAYDNRLIRQLPHDMLAAATQPSGVLHMLALAVFGAVLYLVWRVLKASLRRTSDADGVHTPAATQLSMALLASTLVAFTVFVVTNHYYAVDARYLTIGLFAGVITAATALRRHHWNKPRLVVAAGLICAVATIAAGVQAQQTADNQVAAYASIEQRNAAVATALKKQAVSVLVGDYWRVLPIKRLSGSMLTVNPLASCTVPNGVLTSSAWQPDLRTHKFAYLVTIDGSLTNYPSCSVADITTHYGQPSSIQIIAGTLSSPKEALLLYEHGSHPTTSPAAPQATVESALPVSPDQLTKTSCMQPTVMNIVAHQDDDLLFMNPDLQHELNAGTCVRTVYLTAGDSGYGKLYWLSRQLGAQAAYSTMLGIANVWTEQTLQLSNNAFITVATPQGSKQVSLVFMHLPDGNLQGQGFDGSGNQSLMQLHRGDITAIRAIDDKSSYTSSQLVDALALLMNVYQPAEIHTQSAVGSNTYPDHSDHMAVSAFADEAAGVYDQQHFGGVINVPVLHYIGYPIREYASNVSGDDLKRKEAAFFAYAEHDGGVCSSIAQCAEVPTYESYLSRQYRQ